ncbi:hypothetical protein B0H11DRAFT_2215622 [Mycena galericulata]|nr:hypothetical protein B0H11DRAFT_2215622 [Mycena galericulata]
MKSAFALMVLASLFLSIIVSAFPIIIGRNPTLVSRPSPEHVPFYWKSQEDEEADILTTNDLADEGQDVSGEQSPADIQHVPFYRKSKEDKADTVTTGDLADEGRDVSGKQELAYSALCMLLHSPGLDYELVTVYGSSLGLHPRFHYTLCTSEPATAQLQSAIAVTHLTTARFTQQRPRRPCRSNWTDISLAIVLITS